MKTKKLLARLSSILSWESSQLKARLESLQKLLDKLEAKEKKVSKKLQSAEDGGDAGKGERKRLRHKLKVLRAQRAKGIRLLEDLRDGHQE